MDKNTNTQLFYLLKGLILGLLSIGDIVCEAIMRLTPINNIMRITPMIAALYVKLLHWS